jgi:hypothetical protein
VACNGLTAASKSVTQILAWEIAIEFVRWKKKVSLP